MLRPFRVNGLSPSQIILHFGGSALLLPQQNSRSPAVNRMGMRGDKGMRREGHCGTSRKPSTGIGAAADPADGPTLLELQLGPEPCEVRLRAGSRSKPVGKDDVGPQACGPS